MFPSVEVATRAGLQVLTLLQKRRDVAIKNFWQKNW
jgi:hypothetical protein